MTKEAWIQHIERAGYDRPSRGGNLEAWKRIIEIHKAQGCPECKARMATKRKSANAKAREDAYRLAGLTKVIGSVTGKVYWE